MRPLSILLATIACCLAAAECDAPPTPPAVAIILEQQRVLEGKLAQAQRDWIRTAVNLSPVVVKPLPEDPRQSEIAENRKAKRLFETVDHISDMLQRAEAWEAEQPPQLGRAASLIQASYDSVMENYAALDAAGRIKDTTPAVEAPDPPKP